MNFSQIELDEDYKISFGLDIAGTSTSPSEVRISIGEDVRIMSIARLNSEGLYEATIPVVQGIINNNASLTIEVLLNGKLLVVYRENINFKQPSISVVNKQEIISPLQVAEEISTVDKKEELIIAPAAIEKETIKNYDIPEVVKEDRKIEFTKPIKRDKIQNKPLSLDFSDFSEHTNSIKSVVKESAIKPTVSELKISKVPFKLTKTKIIER